MQIRAFSKINLILDIIRKRPDGYHDLRSVMQTLALHDTVTITTQAEDGQTKGLDRFYPKKQPIKNTQNVHIIHNSNSSADNNDNFILTCDDPKLPTDHRNLVTQAARYMMQEYNITQPIRIHLEKRIPQAAGLAGGSSDCAATLAGFNTLFNLNIPLHSSNQSPTSLTAIGQRFGADVPFCLLGGTALAEGIGEILTPLPSHPHCWVLLVCPDIHVSTREIFEKCKPPIASFTNIERMKQALSQGDLQGIAANLSNDLTYVTAKLHPQINDIIREMKAIGAIGATMSGSGPSVFGYFNNKDIAEKAYKALENIPGRVFLTEIM